MTKQAELKEIRNKAIVKDYNSGMTATELSRKYSLSDNRISVILTKYRVVRPAGLHHRDELFKGINW